MSAMAGVISADGWRNINKTSSSRQYRKQQLIGINVVSVAVINIVKQL